MRIIVESGSHSSGLINREVNRAGARSAVNPHAACDVAGTGNGITATPTWARRGKPRTQTRSGLRVTAPVPDPTGSALYGSLWGRGALASVVGLSIVKKGIGDHRGVCRAAGEKLLIDEE